MAHVFITSRRSELIFAMFCFVCNFTWQQRQYL